MRKKIIIIILIAGLVAAGGLYYFNRFLLPVQLNQFLSQKAKNFLKRDVTVKSVTYSLKKGIVIKGLRIYQKGSSKETLASIDEISFRILIPDFISKKKIIIPHFKIHRARVNIVREKASTWNFSDLIKKKPSGQKSKLPPLLFASFSVSDSRIHLTDQTTQPYTKVMFDQADFQANLSLKDGIKYKISSVLPGEKSSFSVKGRYTLKPRKLTAVLSASNLNLPKFLPLFSLPYQNSFQLGKAILKQAKLNITWQDKKLMIWGGSFKGPIHILLPQEKAIQGNLEAQDLVLKYQKKDWSIQSSLSLKNAEILLASWGTYRGNFFLKEASFRKEKGVMTLEGTGEVQEADIHIGKTFSLKGHIYETTLSLQKESKKISLSTSLNISQAQSSWGKQLLLAKLFRTSNTQISIVNKSVEIISDINADQLVVNLAGSKTIAASPQLNVTYNYDPEASSPHIYNGLLTVNDATLEGLRKVNKLEHIQGNLDFTQETLSTEALQFVALDTPVLLSGTVSNIQEGDAVMHLSSQNVNIQTLASLFPGFLKKFQILLQGESHVEMDFDGKLFAPRDAAIKLNATLNEAILTTPKLPESITHITGLLNYSNNSVDKISWTNLKGLHQGEEYTLNGQLANFDSPSIATTLASTHLSAEAEFNFFPSNIALSLLRGKWHTSSFNLSGNIFPAQDSVPEIDLQGQVGLNLTELRIFLPQFSKHIDAVKPTGILLSTVHYKGNPLKPATADISVQGKSPSLTLWGLTFDNIDLKLTPQDNAMKQVDFTSQFYDGDLSLAALIDQDNETYPFRATGRIDNALLEKISKDIPPLKKRKMAGALSFAIELAGFMGQPETYKGRGNVSLQDGYIWRFQLLNGLLGALLIPGLENIVFTEASTSFLVSDQRVLTEDLLLASETLNLNGTGWIGFDQEINLLVTANINAGVIPKSGPILKEPERVLSTASDLVHVKVYGTLKSPQYSTGGLSGKLFQKTVEEAGNVLKNIFSEGFEGFQDVLGDVLEDNF